MARTPEENLSGSHCNSHDAADLEAVRAAGYTDAQLIDIVAELAFSLVTNLFNHAFMTDVDSAFPVLPHDVREVLARHVGRIPMRTRCQKHPSWEIET